MTTKTILSGVCVAAILILSGRLITDWQYFAMVFAIFVLIVSQG